MGSEPGSNTPYNTDFEPLLSTDDTVEVQPNEGVFAVETVEVMPSVTTQEFTVAANDTLQEEEIRGLYAQDGVLAQYRLPDPTDGGADAFPDGVEITVDQGGEESPRFNNKTQRGVITNEVPRYGDQAALTELYQFEDTDLFFNIENTTGSEVTFELTYTGYLYSLTMTDLAPSDAGASVLTAGVRL